MVLQFALGKFYGIDSFIELLIIIVSGIISYYSHRIYRLINEKNYKFFSLAFLAIAVAFFFKILSNLTILHRIKVRGINFVAIVLSQPEYSQILNFLSYILYKLFMVAGFLILFFIVTRTDKKREMALFLYMGFIAVLFSIYFNFVFHLTLVFILFSLTIHYYNNYLQGKSQNRLLVFIAFLIMLVSNLFFLFSDIHGLFYLAGEALLLIAFSSLLLNQIKIRNKKSANLSKKNEQKKNKARDYKRYSGSIKKQ